MIERYNTLEDTAINKPTPRKIELGDVLLISANDYDYLIYCKTAAKILKDSSEKLFDAWYNGGREWYGSSMSNYQAYSEAFKHAVVEMNNFRTSIFYKLWRKFNPRKKWKYQK